MRNRGNTGKEINEMENFQTKQGSRPSCRDQEGGRGSEEVVPENLGVPIQGYLTVKKMFKILRWETAETVRTTETTAKKTSVMVRTMTKEEVLKPTDLI